MHTIEVPYSAEEGNAVVSCLVASKCGLMAVLEENAQNLLIYNHERRDVLEFPLNSPNFSYASQMAFDMHNNIIIAQGDQGTLLRFNMNGKALPHLEVPVHNVSGIACSPEGEIFLSSHHPYTIVKKAVGQSEWVTIYLMQVDVNEDGYDDIPYYLHESYDEFDPTRFIPGLMSVGSGCELFVTTENCINVLSTFDGKLKRQIGCDQFRDGDLSTVESIFVTGDGYLFVSSADHCIRVFTTDGEYLSKFDGKAVFQVPFGLAVDWNGYLLISDIGDGKIQVF